MKERTMSKKIYIYTHWISLYDERRCIFRICAKILEVYNRRRV